MQNFQDKIAVVQLSRDLGRGKFIRNIPGEGEINPLKIATSIIGFRDSLYAINTNFSELIFGDPATVQAAVVKLAKKAAAEKSKKSEKGKAGAKISGN